MVILRFSLKCKIYIFFPFLLYYYVEFPLNFWQREYKVKRHLCESFVLYCSDSLIQQTGCDLVTLGCQGNRGGAMAVEGTVGESQLQRIIRDLHGTLTLCVCACVRLVVGIFFSTKKTEGFLL